MFESHNKNYEISDEPYPMNNIEHFTEEELDDLNELFSLGFEFSITGRDELISNSKNLKGMCVIFKTVDEWFYVDFIMHNDEERYYRCDQWDGLIQCIKDNIK